MDRAKDCTDHFSSYRPYTRWASSDIWVISILSGYILIKFIPFYFQP